MDKNTQELIKTLQDTIKEQQAFIEKFIDTPLRTGRVVAIDQKRDFCALMLNGGEIVEVHYPKDFAPKINDRVLLAQSGQIVDRLPLDVGLGIPATVERIINANAVEVSVGGMRRVVLSGDVPVKPKLEVLLDTSGSVITDIMPETDGGEIIKDHLVSVAWDEVGGQDEAKEALEEALIAPYQHPDIYAFYGKALPRGILFHGKPGNGKTLLAKAVATRLGQGAKAGGFFCLKGPEVLAPFVGEAERKIRDAFKACRGFADKHGRPAVLFIDEAESLLSRRGSGISSDMQKTIVPTFLAEMDGMETQAAIVILATNRPETLDEAVVRDGRMDRKIEVKSPSLDSAPAIIDVHLRKAPFAKGESLATIRSRIMDHVFINPASIGSNGHSRTLDSVVSGAMLAAIVQHSMAMALRRDLAKGGKPTGLSVVDVDHAIALIQRENTHVTHA